MKHLLLLSLVISLLSCSNKKAEIVEQIKAYKDSMGIVNQREAVLLDEITAAQEKYIGQQSLDTVNAIESRQVSARASISVDRFRFKIKIDSLELELKKY